MGAIRDAGLRVGYDIAVVGFNDVALAAELPIPMTTLASPMEEMGRGAVTLLLQMLAGTRHRGRTNGLDSDHLYVLGKRVHGIGHAAGHRSAAESHEHDVESRIVSGELEPDCGGTLAGHQIQAVLDQIGAIRRRELARQQPGVFDVLAFESHIGAEGSDLAQLERFADLAATTVTVRPRRRPL